jgi:protein transport protein SEC23
MPVHQPGQLGPSLPTSGPAGRFLMPVSEAEFHMTGILEALAKDPWPVENDKRALRCTGVALAVAVGMLEVRAPSLQPNKPLISRIDRFP